MHAFMTTRPLFVLTTELWSMLVIVVGAQLEVQSGARATPAAWAGAAVIPAPAPDLPCRAEGDGGTLRATRRVKQHATGLCQDLAASPLGGAGREGCSSPRAAAWANACNWRPGPPYPFLRMSNVIAALA